MGTDVNVTKERLAEMQECDVAEITDDMLKEYNTEATRDLEAIDAEGGELPDDFKAKVDPEPEPKPDPDPVLDPEPKPDPEPDPVIELPDEFKERYVLKDDFIKGDPVGDKEHPLHQMAVDNSMATHEAISGRRTAEAEVEKLKTALAIAGDTEGSVNNPAEGIFDNMTLEQARDEGKEHKWFDARDDYRTVQSEKKRLKQDQEVANVERAKRSTAFFEANPELKKDEFMERHSGHSFDQCKILDKVDAGGGIDAMLEVARKSGFDEGVTKGNTETLSAITKNASKALPIKAEDGKTKNTSGDEKFVLKSADEVGKMTEAEWDEYDKALRQAEDKGDVSKIGGY